MKIAIFTLVFASLLVGYGSRSACLTKFQRRQMRCASPCAEKGHSLFLFAKGYAYWIGRVSA